jgi:GNAT superfamily N-acetyltransferase
MALSFVRYHDAGWRDPAKPVAAELQALVDQYFQPPGGCLILAYDPEMEQGVLGSAGFLRVTDEICEARNVVVNWDYQGKGIGRGLMGALVLEARRVGYLGMRAEAPDSAPALVGFFEKSGFIKSPAEMQRAGVVRFERAL